MSYTDPTVDPATETAPNEDPLQTTTDLRPHGEIVREADAAERERQFAATAGQAVASAEALTAQDDANGVDRTTNIYDGDATTDEAGDGTSDVATEPAPEDGTETETDEPQDAGIQPGEAGAVDGDGDPIGAGDDGDGAQSAAPTTSEPEGAEPASLTGAVSPQPTVAEPATTETTPGV